MRPRGQTPRMRSWSMMGWSTTRRASMRPRGQTPRMPTGLMLGHTSRETASMRPRGQTPRMPSRSVIESPASCTASMRPRGQTPRMLRHGVVTATEIQASMRPRGQTPRMPAPTGPSQTPSSSRFNEAAGADPADACLSRWFVDATIRFNEAAGADPADATARPVAGRQSCTRASMRPRGQTPRMPSGMSGIPKLGRLGFNEAAGADPADAIHRLGRLSADGRASMRPRGQTPRMPSMRRVMSVIGLHASMRPRGQTPRMRTEDRTRSRPSPGLQ